MILYDSCEQLTFSAVRLVVPHALSAMSPATWSLLASTLSPSVEEASASGVFGSLKLAVS